MLKKVIVIALAILVLHNWLRADISTKHVYCPPAIMDQEDLHTGEMILPGNLFWTLKFPYQGIPRELRKRCVKSLQAGLTMKEM